MSQSPGKLQDFFIKACCFEASLIIIAYALGWIAGIDPIAKFFYSEKAVLYGVIGTLPLVLLFQVAERRKEVSFQKIRRLLLETLGPALYRRHWSDLLILAAIAGVSEEILFRGVIQSWLETVWGMSTGLIACNILFGLVHAITPLYALLAFIIGVYLSMSMDYDGERNLLIPVVIHALYDFWAFLTLVKGYREYQVGKGESEGDDI
jgi:uncharacterized protein